MGMIACAGACVSLSAFGNTTNDWFSVGVSNEAINPVNCSTNGVAVSIANSKIVLDNDYATKFAIEPAVELANTNSTDVAKIDVTALLTPSSTNDLAVIQDAKAGFAVGIDDQNKTNFYGFANGEWIKLTGDASSADTQETTFTIVLDYRVPNVRFYLDGTLLTAATGGASTFDLASGTTGFAGIDAFGSGSIASISGGYEVAVCAVGSTKYGSLADALANGGSSANIVDVNANGTTGDSTAANGASVAVCLALNVSTTDADAALTFVPVPASETAQNIYLQTAIAPVDDVTVTFAVKKGDAAASGSYPANAIPIPKEAGQYTIVPTVSAKSN